MDKILIIIPTYNEKNNIENIINKIISIDSNYHILVIDDNSPDETYVAVRDFSKINHNVKLLLRLNRGGIGTAYCEGFDYAIKNEYSKIIQIDADMSHDPMDIPKLIKLSENYDLVIGSRYINGISIINWPLSRLILSYCANIYAKLLTGMKIMDCTGGFKCFNSKVLKSIDFTTIKSQGYSFQIEVNYLTHLKNFTIYETPIVFKDRTIGKSKMSKRVIFEAIYLVPILRIKSFFCR